MLLLFSLLSVWNQYSYVQTSFFQNRAEDFYTAAVVEYAPFGNPNVDSPLEIISENLANYNAFIREASAKGGDIIVFPEDGITTISVPRKRSEDRTYLQEVPNPLSASAKNICQSEEISSEILKSLSCAALENEIYVVVNLVEIESCSSQNDSNCPSDGFYLYNTNVAFDRYGSIVARYRKFNLYNEPHTNITSEPEHVFFDTDFGGRFGVITCFDILFGDPAIHLVRDYNITDLVYPTAWFQELPFLTADQIQAGWSYGANVNLLGSGYNRPSMGNSGSGIYGGVNGVYTSIISDTVTSKLLMSRVPKKRPTDDMCHKEELKDISLLLNENKYKNSIPERAIHITVWQEPLQSHKTILLSSDQANITLCHCGLCCNMNFHMLPAESSNATAYFRFVAFSGLRYFTGGYYNMTYQVCAVVRCNDNNSVNSCGQLPNEAPVPVFESLQISGNFSVNFLFPNSVTENLGVLPADSFTYKENKIANNLDYILQTTKSLDSFLTLGIYGLHTNNKLCE